MTTRKLLSRLSLILAFMLGCQLIAGTIQISELGAGELCTETEEASEALNFPCKDTGCEKAGGECSIPEALMANWELGQSIPQGACGCRDGEIE